MNTTPDTATTIPPVLPAAEQPEPVKQREAAERLVQLVSNGVGDRQQARGDLRLLCSVLDVGLCDGTCDDGAPSRGPECFEGDLDEARRRAMCGQIDDAIHYLERAPPGGYGVIAERIATHVRTRS